MFHLYRVARRARGRPVSSERRLACARMMVARHEAPQRARRAIEATR